jgi:hypothetical protein
LAQLGITAQKPLYRAMERDETLVHKWLKTESSTLTGTDPLPLIRIDPASAH